MTRSLHRSLGLIGVCLVGVSAGCLSVPTEQCGDLICPPETTCVAALDACFPSDQVDACTGLEEGDTCTTNGVVLECNSGVCATSVCGNGLITSPEDCDGANIGGQTCLSLGYYSGTEPSCQPDCTFDLGACDGRCGDGIVNGPEFCDSAPPEDFDCTNFDFDFGRLSCTSICAPTTESCVRFGVFGIEPPSLDTFRAIHGRGASDVYAITAAELFHFDGAIFTAVPLPPPGGDLDLKDVFAAPDATWVVGADGYVVRIDDTGAASAVDIGTSTTLLEVWASSDDHVWIGGQSELHHFDGASWTDRTAESSATGPFASLWGASSTQVYIGASDALLFYDGAVMTPSPTITRPIAIGGSDANTVYVAQSTGFMFSRSDVYAKDGADWTLVETFGGVISAESGSVSSIEVLSPTNVFVRSHDYAGSTTVRLNHFNGQRWSYLVQSDGDAGGEFYAASPTAVFAAGPLIYGYSGFGFDSGLSGSGTPGGISIRATVALPSGDVFVSMQSAGGMGGGIAHTDGRTWLAGSSVTGIGDLAGRSATEVFHGSSGGVLRYDGIGWLTSLATAAPVRAIAAGDRVIAGDSDGQLYEFDGNNWSTIGNTGTNLLSAQAIPNGAALVDDSGVVHVLSGQNMSTTSSGLPPTEFYASSDSDIYVAAGRDLRHFDGTSWTDVDVGLSLFSILSIDGLAADDIWLIGTDVGGRVVLHYDGTAWFRVKVDGEPRFVDVTERFIAFSERIGGAPSVRLLLRP